jgi:hypothetical protein
MEAMQDFTTPALVNDLVVHGAQLGGGTVHVHNLNVVIDYKCRNRNCVQNSSVKGINWHLLQTACPRESNGAEVELDIVVHSRFAVIYRYASA